MEYVKLRLIAIVSFATIFWGVLSFDNDFVIMGFATMLLLLCFELVQISIALETIIKERQQDKAN